jgi:hypothetical protein
MVSPLAASMMEVRGLRKPRVTKFTALPWSSPVAEPENALSLMDPTLFVPE